MLRYFVQPQVNSCDKSVFGFETLIRQGESGHWHLPKNFEDIPLTVQLQLLEKTVVSLIKPRCYIAFNLNRVQFINAELIDALIEFHRRHTTIFLVAELTEQVLITPHSSDAILRSAKRLRTNGVQLSLDDVGTGENEYEQIKPLLAFTTEIKFAMQNFRRAGCPAVIPDKLKEWKRIAEMYSLRLVVEGVETKADEKILNQIGISLRQGYLYDRPHPVYSPESLNYQVAF